MAGKQFTDLTKASALKDSDIIAVHDGNGLKQSNMEDVTAYMSDKFSNPNLLINPDFKINQRGGSTYSSQYSVDRWKIYNALYNVSKKNLSNSNNSDGNFVQTFENPLNGTYTITVHCSSVTGKANFTWGGESVIVKEEVGDLKEGNNIVTIKATDLRFIGVLVKPGASVIIDYIKLEQGSVATSFVAPNPADELIKCERFLLFTPSSMVGYRFDKYIYVYLEKLKNMRTDGTCYVRGINNDISLLSNGEAQNGLSLGSEISVSKDKQFIRIDVKNIPTSFIKKVLGIDMNNTEIIIDAEIY